MVDYQVGILVNSPFNLFKVIGLDADALSIHKFGSVPVILGHSTIPFYMNMYRLMLPALEEKRKPEKSEYLRHTISDVLLLTPQI